MGFKIEVPTFNDPELTFQTVLMHGEEGQGQSGGAMLHEYIVTVGADSMEADSTGLSRGLI